ncbi:glycosyltransferase family 1 protein [Stipitochalara longipes BDJ]|nr:glycosyltransferase family 1 protein [Stipitochalara longipes BDJ]
MATLSPFSLVVAAILIVVTTAFLRLLYVLPFGLLERNIKHARTELSHMVVVLGSGGHTAEMMSLLRNIDPRRYAHRTYIVSSGDSFSSGKAAEIEIIIQSKYIQSFSEPTKAGVTHPITGTWDIMIVPRARKIHQPLYTAPFSSLWCFIGCLRALYTTSRISKVAPYEYPDAIITNGPATAVMVVLAAIFLKLCTMAPAHKMKIIYVESWARVKTLSLSGKILLWTGVCDTFLVQWESLAKKINGTGSKRKVEWKGFLVE